MTENKQKIENILLFLEEKKNESEKNKEEIKNNLISEYEKMKKYIDDKFHQNMNIIEKM